MLRKFLITIMILAMLPYCRLYSQKPVVIVESTVKIAPFKEEVFYYGFAKGDKLVFNFEEANNKDIKEVEISELPSSVKFMDYKTKKIENKTIDVIATGIYKFRFANSTVFPRVCQFKIQRIPASEATQNFNTTVYNRVVDDTVFTTEQENYIDRTDTVITNFQDRVVKILAPSAGSTNKGNFNFLLPQNTIAWSYYIYTDDAGKKVYDDAVKKFGSNATMNKLSGFFTPLAAEAYGIESHLKKLQTGKSISYWIVEGENAELFMNGDQFRYWKKESGPNDFSKMDYRKGALYFCFSNGASTQPANITVKITSLHVNEVMKTRTVKRVLSIQQKSEMYLNN